MSTERHILRGGLDEVVFYTGAGDVHSAGARTRAAAEGAVPTEDTEYFPAADGLDYLQAQEWRWLPQLVDQRDIDVLQRWRREGKQVGVIGLGPQALLWREMVPILLEDAGAARGRFGGKRLRLVTRRLEADVERSSDFLAGTSGEATEGGSTRWRAALPLPGRLVRLEPRESGNVTARLLGANGTELSSSSAAAAKGEGVYLDLLEGTRDLEVETGGARPQLTLDEDTFALLFEREADGTATLTAKGKGYFEHVADDVRFFDGETFVVGKIWALRPAMVGSQRLRRDGTTLFVTHDL